MGGSGDQSVPPAATVVELLARMPLGLLPRLSGGRSVCAAIYFERVSDGVLCTFHDRHGKSLRNQAQVFGDERLENIQAITKRLATIASSSARSHQLHPTTLCALICIYRVPAFKSASAAAYGGGNRRVTGAVRTRTIANGTSRIVAASCSRRCDLFMQWVVRHEEPR